MNLKQMCGGRQLGQYGVILVALLAVLCFGLQNAGAQAVQPVVGPGSVGSIGGKMGTIVSLPPGMSPTPSPQGLLLPVGTVVDIDGHRGALTEPTPFVMTTGSLRPTTMPSTGGAGDASVLIASVAVFLLAAGLVERWRHSMH
jgi:hypothetical protein